MAAEHSPHDDVTECSRLARPRFDGAPQLLETQLNTCSPHLHEPVGEQQQGGPRSDAYASHLEADVGQRPKRWRSVWCQKSRSSIGIPNEQRQMPGARELHAFPIGLDGDVE